MPFIKVSSPTGNIKFHYTISTPKCDNADKLDPDCPVLLFFHPFAIPQGFHSQFGDPLLRRFNLIVFDLRWHGDTESDRIPQPYGQEEAAEDVMALMDALHLPPCHFIAIDIGSIIALQIVVKDPGRASSLFIMSHICLEELPSVRDARTEMYSLFTSGIPGAQIETGVGYVQYAFSDHMTNLAKALHDLAFASNLRNWSLEQSDAYRVATYDFFINRIAQSSKKLSRITCPVKVLHGASSIVYPLEYTTRFIESLHKSGVHASLNIIPNAPHYMCIDHGEVINPMIYEFVMESVSDYRSCHVLKDVKSPWESGVRAFGWKPERMHDLDDDLITISIPSSKPPYRPVEKVL